MREPEIRDAISCSPLHFISGAPSHTQKKFTSKICYPSLSPSLSVLFFESVNIVALINYNLKLWVWFRTYHYKCACTVPVGCLRFFTPMHMCACMQSHTHPPTHEHKISEGHTGGGKKRNFNFHTIPYHH